MSKIFVSITCGISLLQNLLSSTTFRDYILDKLGIDKNIDVKKLLRDRTFLDILNRDCMVSGNITRKIMELLRQDPVRLCAELNSLIKLIRKINDVERCSVFLFSSDSPSCKTCSHIISRFIVDELAGYIDKNVDIDVKGILTIPDITRGDFSEVLQRLAEGFVREAYRQMRRGFELYTIITGGFKIEVAYITVLSFILRSRIAYCPDPDSDIIILPPIPIDLDHNVLKICESINNGESVNEREVELLKRCGLVSQRNGKIVLEKWVSKLIEARRWNSIY